VMKSAIKVPCPKLEDWFEAQFKVVGGDGNGNVKIEDLDDSPPAVGPVLRQARRPNPPENSVSEPEACDFWGRPQTMRQGSDPEEVQPLKKRNTGPTSASHRVEPPPALANSVRHHRLSGLGSRCTDCHLTQEPDETHLGEKKKGRRMLREKIGPPPIEVSAFGSALSVTLTLLHQAKYPPGRQILRPRHLSFELWALELETWILKFDTRPLEHVEAPDKNREFSPGSHFPLVSGGSGR